MESWKEDMKKELKRKIAVLTEAEAIIQNVQKYLPKDKQFGTKMAIATIQGMIEGYQKVLNSL